MKQILLTLFIALPAHALTLPEAIRAAIERDLNLAAITLSAAEANASALAAEGRFDLIADLTLNASQQSQTASLQGQKSTLDTTRIRLNAGIIQPLVWGSELRLGWINTLTDTDNPFINCVPGVASDQCYESRLELTLRQPLLRGFGRKITELDTERAQQDATIAVLDRDAALPPLIEQVIIAYTELAYAQADQQIRVQALDLAKAQRDASIAQLKAGRLAPVDIPVVEQAVAERARALFIAEQAVKNRRAQLRDLVGDRPLDVERPAINEWSWDEAETRSHATQDHPELAVLDARIRRQQIELGPLQDQTRPRLDLGLTAAQVGLDDGLSGAIAAIPDAESSFYGATLTFQMPIQNRGARGALMRTQATLKRLRAERDARAERLARTATEAWRQRETIAQSLPFVERIAQLAQITLKAEQTRFELGRSTNLDVLRVQQDFAEAQLAVVRAQADHMLALTRLERATSTLLRAWKINARSDLILK